MSGFKIVRNYTVVDGERVAHFDIYKTKWFSKTLVGRAKSLTDAELLMKKHATFGHWCYRYDKYGNDL